ncbi:hypothetical protein J6590_029608 [Homalodisca vitripennis]|nr:hypothetical protein J6590_029608 [Homalodisca vitripennis]
MSESFLRIYIIPHFGAQVAAMSVWQPACLELHQDLNECDWMTDRCQDDWMMQGSSEAKARAIWRMTGNTSRSLGVRAAHYPILDECGRRVWWGVGGERMSSNVGSVSHQLMMAVDISLRDRRRLGTDDEFVEIVTLCFTCHRQLSRHAALTPVVEEREGGEDAPSSLVDYLPAAAFVTVTSSLPSLDGESSYKKVSRIHLSVYDNFHESTMERGLTSHAIEVSATAVWTWQDAAGGCPVCTCNYLAEIL